MAFYAKLNHEHLRVGDRFKVAEKGVMWKVESISDNYITLNSGKSYRWIGKLDPWYNRVIERAPIKFKNAQPNS